MGVRVVEKDLFGGDSSLFIDEKHLSILGTLDFEIAVVREDGYVMPIVSVRKSDGFGLYAEIKLDD